MRRTPNMLGCLLVACAVAGCGCGKTGSARDDDSGKCTRAKDCDTATETRGWLCISGSCQRCESDVDCREVTYYGAESACAAATGRCSRGADAGKGGGDDGGGSSSRSVASNAGAGGAADAAAGGGGAGSEADSNETDGDSTHSKCSAGEAKGPDGDCVRCQLTCDGPGETGDLHPATTENGLCLCETAPGYFLALEGGIGTYPCDADEDGWVRDTAKRSIESTDPAVKENARCVLRRAESIVLENVDGETYPLYFADTEAGPEVTEAPALGLGSLPLYESERNDEQVKLTGEQTVPRLGDENGARSLRAEELNSLTKACVSANGDHNDNVVNDVDEWGRPPDTEVDVPEAGAGRDAYRKLYARFSYFVELHEAWFTASRETNNGRTVLGAYTIRERTRAVGDPDDFPLRYGMDPRTNALTSDFWQFCPRGRDVGYCPPQAQGECGQAPTYDFASVSGPEQSRARAALGESWHGMMHHSQFKCVQIVDDAEYAAANAQQDGAQVLVEQTPASLKTLGWTVNDCSVSSEPVSALAAPNPARPPVVCAPSDPRIGDVRWTVVGIDSATDYKRGCIAQCAGEQFLCPGSATDGEPKPCYSMCGDFSASYPLLIGSDAGVGYTIRGEISRQVWGNSGAADGSPDVLGTPGQGYSITVLGVP